MPGDRHFGPYAADVVFAVHKTFPRAVHRGLVRIAGYRLESLDTCQWKPPSIGSARWPTLQVPECGYSACLHRPLVTIETIFTYLHGLQGFSARHLEDGLAIRHLVKLTQASKGLQDP